MYVQPLFCYRVTMYANAMLVPTLKGYFPVEDPGPSIREAAREDAQMREFYNLAVMSTNQHSQHLNNSATTFQTPPTSMSPEGENKPNIQAPTTYVSQNSLPNTYLSDSLALGSMSGNEALNIPGGPQDQDTDTEGLPVPDPPLPPSVNDFFLPICSRCGDIGCCTCINIQYWN
jgi:hypothetical protein